MATEVCNSDDVIDSRDVNSQIEDMESEREDLSDAVASAEEALSDFDADTLPEGADPEAAQEKLQDAVDAAQTELDSWDQDNEDTLNILKKFREEGQDATSEWDDGATCIRDDYFEEYAKELVEELGYMPKDFPSFIEIDWEATARNLESDYTSIEFDGVTYLVRG